MDFDDIERILELMRLHDLAEFELEREGLKVRARKTATGYAALPVAPQIPNGAPAALPPPAMPAASLPPAASAEAEEESVELAVVKSPIVGTFYRSPEPGAASVVPHPLTVDASIASECRAVPLR